MAEKELAIQHPAQAVKVLRILSLIKANNKTQINNLVESLYQLA